MSQSSEKVEETKIRKSYTLRDAAALFTEILIGLEKDDIDKFSRYAITGLQRMGAFVDEKEDKQNIEKEERLALVVQDLRKRVSISAEAPNEQIFFNKLGQFKDYTSQNTVHADAFLYNDDDLDELCDEGLLARNYCLDCGSRNTSPLNMISHSFSRDALHFIFGSKVLGDLSGKTVLDIGSRLGSVLYFGHIFSSGQIIGVETNNYFVKLQQEVVNKYKMQDRCKVVHADVFTQQELVDTSDVVIMHNVFEFFASKKTQKSAWVKIRDMLTKAAQKKRAQNKKLLLLACPPVQDSLAGANAGFGIDGWLKEITLEYPENEHGHSHSHSHSHDDHEHDEHGCCSHKHKHSENNDNNGEEEEGEEDQGDELRNIHLYEVL